METKKATNPNFTEFLKEEGKEEANEMLTNAGYQEWAFKLRASDKDGILHQEDVEFAEKRIAALASKKSRALTMTWNELGPNNVGGRTRALIVDKNNPNKLFMGSVGGGLWVSTNDGNSWEQAGQTDKTGSISVCAITQAANGDIFYGTGEGMTSVTGTTGFTSQPFQIGKGIFKSTDGGATFTQLPNTVPASSNSNQQAWSYVNTLKAHPTDANKIFAGTNGGLRVTSNGGADAWPKPTGLTTFNSKIIDLDISSDGSKVIASSNNSIFISNDGGTTFGANVNSTALTNGLPGSTGITRIELAMAPSNKDIIYAIFVNTSGAASACYRTTNGGTNWSKIMDGGSSVWNPLGNQGEYDIAFGVHPTDPEMVFLGGQFELQRRTSTSTNFPAVAFWVGNPIAGKYVHADMHGIIFNPSNPEKMYVINDGGIFRTENASAASPFFVEKNKNYNTTQCYGMAANYLGHVMQGTQDNGSNLINGQYSNSPLASSRQMGGDGTRCVMSDLDPKVIIGSIINGQVRKAADGGVSQGSWKEVFDVVIDNNEDGYPEDLSPGENGANWIAPILLKEKMKYDLTNDSIPNVDTLKNIFLLGSRSRIWMTQGMVTSGSPIWFSIAQVNNAGFSALAMSDDGQVVYAGASNGNVYRITGLKMFDTLYDYVTKPVKNATVPAWNNPLITVDVIGNYGRYITDLECDASGNTLIVTLPNFANTNYVYRFTDARSAAVPTSASIQGNLPPMPVYTCTILKGTNKYLVGTEYGIWGTENGGATWTDCNNLNDADPTKWHPKVICYELINKGRLKINGGGEYVNDVIYSATHGRGMFSSTSLAAFWPQGISETAKKPLNLTLYPNPVINQAFINITAENATAAQLKIYTVTGTLVYSSNTKVENNKIAFDASNLSNGIYIVRLKTNDGFEGTTKFIK